MEMGGIEPPSERFADSNLLRVYASRGSRVCSIKVAASIERIKAAKLGI